MPNPLNVPITPPRVAFIDPRTNNVSREWYMFFLSLFQTAAGSTVSLDDLQKGPPVLTIDEVTAAINRSVGDLTPAPGTSELQAVIDAVRQELELLPRQELGTMAALQQANLPWVTFDNTPQTVPTNVPGTLYWDQTDGNKTLNLVMEGGLVTQQIGEEQYYRIKADSTITEGQVIMFTGTVGASGALKGAPATGLTAATALYVMGVATENIATNGWGYVTSFGLVRGINTTGGAEAWANGQILYLNPAVAGGLTKTVPVAPNPKVVVAAVVYAATNGSLFIRPAFGGKLGDFEGDVNISSPVNGDLLIYDAVQGRWENATLTAGSNVTITNGPGSITIASSNPGGTVTSVGLSAPTGFSVSGSPVTSSGTLALSFAAGYSLPTTTSQSNWDTAYSERRQWDGGSTGLVAATGRTSLGATTVGSNLFTLTNPSAVTYMRINADNSVSTLDAATFRTAIGAGTGNGTVTAVTASSPLASSGGTAPNITITGSALTKTDDTNVTLTLGGTPASALLTAVSLTLGWTGQLAISRGGTGQSSFTANYVHYGSFSTSANLQFDGTNLGIGGAPTYSVDIKSTTANGALRVYSNASSTTPAMYVAGSGTVNGVNGSPNGNGLMIVYRDSGNLRSISAAGSINAAGLDYAEYMPKVSDFVLKKGDICGINADGLLTDRFEDAISFVVKTTNPSYVGGDAWFTEPAPDAPVLAEDASEEDQNAHDQAQAEYEVVLAAWKQRHEEARAKVDRIAFCGQVPVNVYAAKPGQFIIPVNNNGLIEGVAVSNPSFDQYMSAVGKVIAVDADGRAKIIVKII